MKHSNRRQHFVIAVIDSGVDYIAAVAATEWISLDGCLPHKALARGYPLVHLGKE